MKEYINYGYSDSQGVNQRRKKIANFLQDLYDNKMPFQLGTHCTTSENVCKSICSDGLHILSGRALEGTLTFKGDLSEARENDLESFGNGWAWKRDYVVLVAIPNEFDGHSLPNGNDGGYKCEN